MDATVLSELTVSFFVLVLASFIGFEVISKVPTTLHTPLMSGSNAISGIILVGAILVSANTSPDGLDRWLALCAVALASVNVVGGFVVTDRMLGMFKKKKKPAAKGAS
jgi:NAD(P) transhydrogenase subunit alpha